MPTIANGLAVFHVYLHPTTNKLVIVLPSSSSVLGQSQRSLGNSPPPTPTAEDPRDPNYVTSPHHSTYNSASISLQRTQRPAPTAEGIEKGK
jgi:hypothetical protein